MEGLPLLITVLDNELRFVWLNRLAREFYGVETAALVGKSAEEILHVGDAPRLYQLRREALQTKQERSEVVPVKRGRRTYTFAANFQPVCDEYGNLIYLIAAHRDVSRESRLSEARNEVYELFNRILDTMPLGFLATDQYLHIMRSNSTACRMFRIIEKEELIGIPVHKFLASPEYIESKLEALFNPGEAETAAVADLGEVGAKNSEGREYPAHIWAFRMKLGDFPLIAFLLMDLSDIREAEAKILETQQQMQQMQKHEALGQLAGNIAHDFNNLMAIVLGYSDTIKEKHGADAETRRMMDEVCKAVQRGTSLTKQILAYAKHQNLDLKVSSLHELILSQENMLRAACSSAISLEFDLSAKTDRVRLDEGQLMQVLLNLAVNARDAMPDGGTLQVRTADTIIDDAFFELHAGSGKKGPYLLISVKDNGCGIPEHQISRIFDPYFSTKPRDKGTGLGLSVVYGIVKQLEGFIYCESQEDTGTEFLIYLPVCEADAYSGIEQQGSQSDSLQPNDYTILVVDDEEPLRLIISKHLQLAGYRTYSASGGRDALDFIDSFPEKISLILSDIMMPEMSGLEMAEEARLMQPDTPILFMSGYSKELLMTKKPSGDFSLITKPFSREVLLSEVRKILRAHRAAAAADAALTGNFEI